MSIRELVQFEIDVLRGIAGEDVPGMSWGATMGVAVETLAARGFCFRNHEHRYVITDEGRAVLRALEEEGR